MGLRINNVNFDLWEGVIVLPRNRVQVYSPSETANVASQLLPSVGEPFTIKTTFFDLAATYAATAISYEQQRGQIVTIIRDGYDYALNGWNFLAQSVETEHLKAVTRAVGTRNGTPINLSPAFEILTTWTLIARPV